MLPNMQLWIFLENLVCTVFFLIQTEFLKIIQQFFRYNSFLFVPYVLSLRLALFVLYQWSTIAKVMPFLFKLLQAQDDLILQ